MHQTCHDRGLSGFLGRMHKGSGPTTSNQQRRDRLKQEISYEIRSRKQLSTLAPNTFGTLTGGEHFPTTAAEREAADQTALAMPRLTRHTSGNQNAIITSQHSKFHSTLQPQQYLQGIVMQATWRPKPRALELKPLPGDRRRRDRQSLVKWQRKKPRAAVLPALC